MSSETIPVRLEINTPAIRQEFEQILQSVQDFTVLSPTDLSSSEIMVFEVGLSLEGEFDHIDALINSGMVNEVFLTGPGSDASILLQALKVGAKEFFPQPIDSNEVLAALERFRERREKVETFQLGKAGRIITTIGSKGGVGTTTTAVNLAVALSQLNGVQSVALVDMKLPFGEVPLFLDVHADHHWGSIARDVYRLDSTYLMSIMARHPSGVLVMPSPNQLDGHPIASVEAIEQLFRLMQSLFDFVVVDAGQSLNELGLKVVEMSDEILVFSVLSVPCLANLNAMLRSFNHMGYPPDEKIKVVISREGSDISVADAERSIDKNIFWRIPNDFKSTMSALNQGKTVLDTAPSSPFSKSLRQMALELAGSEFAVKKKRSFLGRLFRFGR